MVVQLVDGTELRIRPIRPADKARLSAGLTRLSETSVQRRFLGPKPRLTQAELRYLTEVDGHDHYAIVAVLADRPEIAVASARFVRLLDDPTAAEAAIVVADPLQGTGLGKRMSLALADAARERGITRFTATIASDNPAALALMRTLSERLEDAGHSGAVRELVAVLPAAA